MAKYTILLFGPAASSAGASCIEVELETGSTCAQLIAEIGRVYPMLDTHLKVGRLAINNGFVAMDKEVDSGAEIALITMVSGG